MQLYLQWNQNLLWILWMCVRQSTFIYFRPFSNTQQSYMITYSNGTSNFEYNLTVLFERTSVQSGRETRVRVRVRTVGSQDCLKMAAFLCHAPWLRLPSAVKTFSISRVSAPSGRPRSMHFGDLKWTSCLFCVPSQYFFPWVCFSFILTRRKMDVLEVTRRENVRHKEAVIHTHKNNVHYVVMMLFYIVHTDKYMHTILFFKLWVEDWGRNKDVDEVLCIFRK